MTALQLWRSYYSLHFLRKGKFSQKFDTVTLISGLRTESFLDYSRNETGFCNSFGAACLRYNSEIHPDNLRTSGHPSSEESRTRLLQNLMQVPGVTRVFSLG